LFVGDLNRVYRQEPAMHEVDFQGDGFRWIQADDAHNSVYAFMRIAKDPRDFLVVVANFTPVVRPGYHVGVPRAGFYTEILNSDAKIYGGSDVGNAGGVSTKPEPHHGHEQSLALTLPPLSMVVLKPSAG
jgi:1,4-alpha-glucan branching enzyme